VEERVETFEPLVTEIHPAAEASVLTLAIPDPVLPAGLVRLNRTGREARNALLASGLLALVSLVLLTVLLLTRGTVAEVVWQEESQSIQSVLVEAP
jgi:hypothetical protein